MKDKKVEKYILKTIDGKEVSGDSYEDVTIKYLEALINEYSYLSPKERLVAYIKYFYRNFQYDKQMAKDIVSSAKSETDDKNITSEEKANSIQERNKYRLYRLFHDRKGVCMQFAQGMALLTFMDREMYEKLFNMGVNGLYHTFCKIIDNGDEVGHAINLYIEDNKIKVLDISSMIHCYEQDKEGEVWDYGLIPLEDYILNQKDKGFRFTYNARSHGRNAICLYSLLNCFNSEDHNQNIGLYYSLLNLDIDSINNNSDKLLNSCDITDIVESSLRDDVLVSQ